MIFISNTLKSITLISLLFNQLQNLHRSSQIKTTSQNALQNHPYLIYKNYL